MMNRIPIDLTELKRLRAIGFTIKQCAARFNCSTATIGRRLNPKLEQLNKDCQKRYYYEGRSETEIERCCKYCHRFYTGHKTSNGCSGACKQQLIKSGYTKFSKRQLLSYTNRVGLSRQSLQKIGYTEAEYLEVIK